MKNLFFLICGLLFCMNSMADGLYISLYPKGESATRDFRSLEIIPTATHDRNQVSIYSEKELESVLIRVTDSLGSVLFEQELNSLIGQYTFQLPASGNGCLTLDIITSTEQYEGDFSLK